MKKDRTSGKAAKAGKIAMIAAGVSIGVALTVCVIVGKGVKNCIATIDGLKDENRA